MREEEDLRWQVAAEGVDLGRSSGGDVGNGCAGREKVGEGGVWLFDRWGRGRVPTAEGFEEVLDDRVGVLSGVGTRSRERGISLP